MDDLTRLRKKIFQIGYRGGMAHLASCFSSLEMIYALYNRGILRFDPENPKWEDRDRFILSKGHAGLALYTVLWDVGLIPEAVLLSYLQDNNSFIGGEPCIRDCEWIEATTGSLGHGLSMGLGMAMAFKADQRDAKVYVMLGDGECQEGSVWEAAMMAAALKLDNLIAILDCNQIQKMDYVEKTMGKIDWKGKWESFGWEVEEVDGHNIEAFVSVIKRSNSAKEKEKPRMILAHTIKGKGVSIMENNPNWHFKLPGKKELKIFEEELGISEEEWR